MRVVFPYLKFATKSAFVHCQSIWECPGPTLFSINTMAIRDQYMLQNKNSKFCMGQWSCSFFIAEKPVLCLGSTPKQQAVLQIVQQMWQQSLWLLKKKFISFPNICSAKRNGSEVTKTEASFKLWFISYSALFG